MRNELSEADRTEVKTADDDLQENYSEDAA
jgi:hypothetical protein